MPLCQVVLLDISPKNVRKDLSGLKVLTGLKRIKTSAASQISILDEYL